MWCTVLVLPSGQKTRVVVSRSSEGETACLSSAFCSIHPRPNGYFKGEPSPLSPLTEVQSPHRNNKSVLAVLQELTDPVKMAPEINNVGLVCPWNGISRVQRLTQCWHTVHSSDLLLTLVLWNSCIPRQRTTMGRLLFICFSICDRANVGRRGLLEEVNEGILEPLGQRSVILILKDSTLWSGNVRPHNWLTLQQIRKQPKSQTPHWNAHWWLAVLKFNFSCLLCAAQWRNLITSLDVNGQVPLCYTLSLNACYSQLRGKSLLPSAVSVSTVTGGM